MSVPDDVREAICAKIEESLRGISVGEDADGMSYGILDAIAEARHETDLRGAGDILRDASADIVDAALSALEAAGFEVNRKGTDIFSARVQHLIQVLDARGTGLYPDFVLPEAIESVRAMLTASRHKEKDDG